MRSQDSLFRNFQEFSDCSFALISWSSVAAFTVVKRGIVNCGESRWDISLGSSFDRVESKLQDVMKDKLLLLSLFDVRFTSKVSADHWMVVVQRLRNAVEIEY